MHPRLVFLLPFRPCSAQGLCQVGSRGGSILRAGCSLRAWLRRTDRRGEEVAECSQRFHQLGRGIPAGERVLGGPVLRSWGLWWVLAHHTVPPHAAGLMGRSCLVRGVLALPQERQDPGAGAAGVTSVPGSRSSRWESRANRWSLSPLSGCEAPINSNRISCAGTRGALLPRGDPAKALPCSLLTQSGTRG